MGIFDTIAGLFSGNSNQAAPQGNQQQPASAPVSSPPPQAQPQYSQQAQAPQQAQQVQQVQQEQLSQNARMITDTIAPAIIQLAGNEEGEQRANRITKNMAVLTEWGSKETARLYDNLEDQRQAVGSLIDAQQLSQMMQLDQIEQADSRAMEANQLFRDQIAPINEAISEDTADLAEARKLQNSGNPLSWIFGKIKEEYNNETLATAQQQQVTLQQSAQLNFALNTAERALTSKQMAAAGKREIIAKGLVSKLQANEAISGKELEYISKQLGLNDKELSGVMSTLNYDLSKQQLSIQKAHLALAQAQESRQKEQWKLSVANYTDAKVAGEEAYQQLKALNLADKPGTTRAQILKAYTNPSAADAMTINAITTAFGGNFAGAIFNDTGTANLRYEDIANNPTLSATHPSLVQVKDAVDGEMQNWLATPAGMTSSDEQKAARRNSLVNQFANSLASDGQQHLTNGTVTIPTIAVMAETQKNLAVYNQKALDTLKTLQTTLNTPNDNSKFFDDVVVAAEKNGVGLDVMANQLTANYRQMVAENRRAGNLLTNPNKFVVGLSDNYSGPHNNLSGTFSKRAGGVDLLSAKDIHNLLLSASKRRKTAAAMQVARESASFKNYAAGNGYMNDLISSRPSPLPQGVGFGRDFSSVKTEY